ncbi:uncharacterized protein DNG_01267 [Cephalotrichum gorgonifer]|uniref:Uncharacterized protein n=1 Tax=Cephalotrichum gorgonifer TaxID=2041049 RepID=A0AAE8SS10_9PEZI|nr:uncharacterized protein DNG_01267 [Cephalotrichum gorgonifer]
MDQTLQRNGDNRWPRTPYIWIIAPLLIFVAIALIATFIQCRRRRVAHRRAAPHTHRVYSQSPPAAVGGDDDRDLEWGWTGRGRERRWVGVRRRDEEPVEGLDEHGEAPPPYEPAAAAKKGNDVELREVGVEGRPPGYEEDAGIVAPPPAAVTHSR